MTNNDTNYLKELVILFSILVKRGVPQSTLIREMSEAGFEPKRIAELLGTTSNTVSVTLHKTKTIKGKKNE